VVLHQGHLVDPPPARRLVRRDHVVIHHVIVPRQDGGRSSWTEVCHPREWAIRHLAGRPGREWARPGASHFSAHAGEAAKGRPVVCYLRRVRPGSDVLWVRAQHSAGRCVRNVRSADGARLRPAVACMARTFIAAPDPGCVDHKRGCARR